MINQETIDKIKQVTDPVSVISQFVKLARKGTSYRGLCPFHQEQNASFSVLPSKGIYKCFSCGETGDVITFLMKQEAISFDEAVRRLAVRSGILVEDAVRTTEDKKHHEARECFFTLNEAAAECFVCHLDREEAQVFLDNRGIDTETVSRFRLGFAPGIDDLLLRTLIKKGYSEELLVTNGLVFMPQSKSRLMDRFRNRMIFPIRNLSGRTVAFGGRLIVNNPKIAKYHNSPESIYYQKRRELYGLFEGKKAITKEGNCFVVEGYTDVLRLSAGGVEETVAPLGTALTIDQVKLLKRFTRCVTLMTDGDDAGRKSALAMLKLFLAEDFEVYLFPLPQGEDPDSYGKMIPEGELRMKLYAGRQDALLYFAGQIWQAAGNEALRKSKALQGIVELLACICDPIRRHFYMEQITALTGFRDIRALDPKSYPVNQTEPAVSARNKLTTREKTERRLISWLIHRGEERLVVVLGNNEIWNPNVREFVHAIIELEGIQWQTSLCGRIWTEIQTVQVPGQIGYKLYYQNHSDPEIAGMVCELTSPDANNAEAELRSILISMRSSDIRGVIGELCTQLSRPIGETGTEEIKLQIIKLKKEWYILREYSLQQLKI